MSKRNDLLLLNDIAEAIAAIEEYIHGLDEDAFYNDRKTKDAVVRNFEIIGEASKQITQDYKIQHPNVVWREAADLRNKIIHEYFGLDYVLLWEIIQLDLPLLKQDIQILINNYPKE